MLASCCCLSGGGVNGPASTSPDGSAHGSSDCCRTSAATTTSCTGSLMSGNTTIALITWLETWMPMLGFSYHCLRSSSRDRCSSRLWLSATGTQLVGVSNKGSSEEGEEGTTSTGHSGGSIPLQQGMHVEGREGKGRQGKKREGKGRQGKGREGKGREGRNQSLQHQIKLYTERMIGQMNKQTQGLADRLQLLLTMTMSLNFSPEQALAK